jgi:hypothetical protein
VEPTEKATMGTMEREKAVVAYMTASFQGPEVVLAWRALALLRTSASLDARRLSRIVGQFLVAARAHDDLVFFGLGAGVPRETFTGGWSRLE